MENVRTKYFCIFNADGSFNPIELDNMYKLLKNDNYDIIFASRYEKNCSSEDDTLITLVGNFIFTKIGNIFFNLKITDILYTFVMGDAEKTRKLNKFISLDTRKSWILEKGIKNKVNLINDVSGLVYEANTTTAL